MLAPVMINSTASASTIVAPKTSPRRAQYVCAASGPTGRSRPLIEASLGSTTWPRVEARRSGGSRWSYWARIVLHLLRRSDGTFLASRSDDEVGGARSQRAERAIRQSTVAQVSTGVENRPLSSSRARAAVGRILSWYATNARDLPWRRTGATPWAIMVSEFMLQQTPVERVRRPWQAWLERWPTPASLAAAAPGDAVRAWGRLGYPRRALRLHQAAQMIMNDFDGQVPEDREALLRLPWVGSYTAAAIQSFAYGRREMVLDTNVRRLLTRLTQGVAYPSSAPTGRERTLAEQLAPRSPQRAARWAVASMELGATVCRARTPNCAACPVASLCAWREAGYPAWEGAPRRAQAYQGTDRQCRGALLAVLRSTHEPIAGRELAQAWQDLEQRDRALASLVQDGLVVAIRNRWSLPG
jgi:A/G-specific adenine glycosylase